MRKFRKWVLKEYGEDTWAKYKANVKAVGSTLKEVDAVAKRCPIISVASCAFCWDKSPEGMNFWAKLTGKYYGYINK